MLNVFEFPDFPAPVIVRLSLVWLLVMVKLPVHTPETKFVVTVGTTVPVTSVIFAVPV